MSADQINKDEISEKNGPGEEEETDLSYKSGTNPKIPVKLGDDSTLNLSKMYQSWFLDYASYVILERAVPHISDGLKPVQRRILHSMKRMDDGRYNKVANIIGNTMQYHPHGDASIGDALVQLGQKDLLIDTQGNWGNILTGDGAAAPRYIEARLTKFALEVLFNPKTTEWKASYDGRNKEPVTLPAKFPLLLAQGAEGIAVGLSSKILPHNFNELCDAAIAYLEGKQFRLYPDFQTGGYIDVEKYNDGERGGSVKVRSTITKLDNKTLVIKDIPFGRTTASVVDSILKANEKGKIKIKKVDDITAQNVEIQVQLAPGVSSDKTIDALYAFTDCEISISPNCCVIDDNKPHFLTVSDVMRVSVDTTKESLRLELEIERTEKQEALLFASLEKIFIEERIYKDKEFENAGNMDIALTHIDKRLTPFKAGFIREITRDDLVRLMEIKMARILKFNSDKANELIARLLEEIDEITHHLNTLVDYTISWYLMLKDRYGKNYPRKTEIRSFENIEAVKVAEANEKLYVNREEGFIGTGMKKDEFVCNCSDIDDAIVFFKDGKYKVVKVSEKMFVGKGILYASVFKKNDKRTIYNVVYRDGKTGAHYIKRFPVTGVTRDKEYDLTKGKPGSRIAYFSANPNGEAETIKVILKPKPRLRILQFEKDFSEIDIKGRGAMGNILTKADVHRIQLKHKGLSTLGGRKVWFDPDVLRLNYEGGGKYLGEFQGDDMILVTTRGGDYRVCNFDLTNHFPADIHQIEKFEESKIWSAALFDADQGFAYLKRFTLEASEKPLNFLGDNPDSRLFLLTDVVYPRIKVIFGGNDDFREPLEIEVDEFIGVKGYKAKGKRISNFEVKTVEELEPLRFPEPEPEQQETMKVEIDEENGENSISDADLRDEITGQMKLFD
ncbi:MAG: DNA topoisomerase IV [Bacteroidetes bacterium GWD2_45_23]|nr:MAG: DNA topoisomerase IV [Bacteroidetes bacterium GWC2_46_850]OFX84575.1 MAG: DNA topoisomerase IV [Bacteroidetes bacterium GWD2_45_23]HAR38629.1 DNA gyrase/topoisomerase IV subunit A [Porphyromonadaceae bacterium]HBB00199.1 DNA gyrase/topoisomerase IV subunit A [Porphyromonadaceae bacterium]HCC18126.1 DNA gyrase/topoisomerase IV subunit A [Porphyromonadaceae bacterium]